MKKAPSKRSRQTIIWAIDPFESKNETRSHVIAALREFADRGALIEPVHVLRPDDYDMSMEFNMTWLKHVTPAAQKALVEFVKGVPIPNMAAPRVIAEKRPSLTRAALSLIAHAKSRRAAMIVLGTHGRSGLSRLFMGSFAETVILRSPTPVLVVGPRSEASGTGIRRILFATDFGPASLPTFRKVLAFAKGHGAAITLMHCLPHRLEPVIGSGAYLIGGAPMIFPDLETRNEERRRASAKRFVELGKKQDVLVEVEINPGRGSVAEALAEQARERHADMIAMAAQSGSVSAALLGSVTRQVLRAAPCPVWVLRAS